MRRALLMVLLLAFVPLAKAETSTATLYVEKIYCVACEAQV